MGSTCYRCRFCSYGLLKSPSSMLAWCRRSGTRKLHYARLWFVSQQEHLFPHCFGTFSISSFCLILFSVKIIGKQFKQGFHKEENSSYFAAEIQALLWDCLRIHCQDYMKCSTETSTSAVTDLEAYLCATENPKQGIFRTGKLTAKHV